MTTHYLVPQQNETANSFQLLNKGEKTLLEQVCWSLLVRLHIQYLVLHSLGYFVAKRVKYTTRILKKSVPVLPSFHHDYIMC